MERVHRDEDDVNASALEPAVIIRGVVFASAWLHLSDGIGSMGARKCPSGVLRDYLFLSHIVKIDWFDSSGDGAVREVFSQ